MTLLGRLGLDARKPRSLQAQLSGQLKELIQRGELLSGERLPSTREMANDLQVSRNTVVAAYEMLVGQGYLEAHLRSGFRVCSAAQAFRTLPVNVPRRNASSRLPGRVIPFLFVPRSLTSIYFPCKYGTGTAPRR
jgi:DNA-binding transcriptional regulator YhcF (GntR family)